jgi:hypothetical protein
VRWRAAHRPIGAGDLVGCDFNESLVAAASALATAEHLDCTFLTADALALAQPAHVVISTGFLHHLRGDDLLTFLGRQQDALAFAHWDIATGRLTRLGAWLFHQARMREPLARHDGVISARRAYDDAALIKAVRSALPGRVPLMVDASPGRNPLVAVMRPVLGLQRELVEPFLTACPPSLRRRLHQP